MYTIEAFTHDGDTFQFRQYNDKMSRGPYFLVGSKILSYIENTVFDLIDYKFGGTRSSKKVEIVKYKTIQKNGQLKVVENEKTAKLEAFILCADRFEVPILPSYLDTKTVLIRSQYRNNMTYKNPVYLDVLYNSLVDFSILIQHKLTLLSYGLVVFENDTTSRTVSRLLLDSTEFNMNYLLNLAENNLLLVNLRFSKEYTEPGRVVLFEKDGRLVYFFQCVCCTNTNRSVKHKPNEQEEITVDLRKSTNKSTNKQKRFDIE